MASPISSTTSPWGPAADYWAFGLGEGRRLYNSGQPTVQPFTGWQEQGLQMTADRARAGAPNRAAAYGAVGNALQPGQNPVTPWLASFRDPMENPYLDSVVNRTTRGVSDRVNAQFGASGRTGSGYHAATLARELADAEGAIRAGAYESDRGRQLQAAQLTGSAYASDQARALEAARLSPWLAQQDYADADRLVAAGGAYQQQRERELLQPYDRLGRYMGFGAGAGGMGQTTVSEQPSYGSPLLTGLGAAATGVGILGDVLPWFTDGGIFGGGGGNYWDDVTWW